MSTQQGQAPYYFVPSPSKWPVLMGTALLVTMAGASGWVNGYSFGTPLYIIGLLAAIALPSFLNQANKARFAEAKSYIATMSRLQQVYYLEKQIFTSDINKLGLGVDVSSSSFQYSILGGSVSGNPSPVQLDQIVTNVATPKSFTKAFLAVVGIPGVVRIDTVFCLADTPGISPDRGRLNITTQSMECPNNFSPQ